MAVAFERPQSQNMPIVDCGRQRPVSALARGVQITELCDGSHMNPDPVRQPESPTFRDQCLSPTKLQLLTGSDQLEGVSSVELKVDTSHTSLNNFGLLLPNLTVLKLSGSVVPSIRDLGSSLQQLEVLWLRSCGVQELEGLCSMGRLRELYLAYNDVSDLTPLSLMDLLQILDLEGNNIDDIDQLESLALCSSLQQLTLEGNPLCVAPHPDSPRENYDYRQAVRRILTNLSTLDDRPLTGAHSGSSSPQNVFDADWAFLEELQGDALLIESLENESETVSEAGRPTTAALLPATGYRPGSALKSASSMRPGTSATRRPASISGGRPSSAWTDSSKPRPASSDGVEGVESASDLTCGRVICGNPSKALRARRHSEAADDSRDSPASDPLSAKPPVPKPSGSLALNLRPTSATKRKEAEDEDRKRQEGGKTEEEEEGKEAGPIEDKDLSSLLLELKSWKKEHEHRLEKIRESKTAQVLKIEEGLEVRDSNLSPAEDTDTTTDLSTEQSHTPAHRFSSSAHPSASHNSAFSHDGDESIHSPPSADCAEKLVSRRNSSCSLREGERCVKNEDSGLLKEYRRLSLLERQAGRQIDSGDHNHLRELRIPSPVHRTSNRQRGILPPPPPTRKLPETPPSPGRESPPKDRPRKVRIGPTGLPGSSHSKHTQGGDLMPSIGRGGGGGPMPPSVHRPPLPPTPSQHRVRRSLPEVTPLPSRPTPLFRS